MSTSENPRRDRPAMGIVLGTALVAALVVLLAHAWYYRFQCDDAYISFRYARNLSAGHGLVFNPGLERVEGYTNFLWVILLAGLARLGLDPVRAADALSLIATLVLWAMTVWFAMRRRPANLLAAVPVLFLAVTRSVAVWSTGGLETRLYEVLFLGAIMRCVVELQRVGSTDRPPKALAGWLFGLAALTRTEGAVVAVPVLGLCGWLACAKGREGRAWLWSTLGPFVAVCAAHIVFRRAYYGEWLPNTFYAKVGPRPRWEWAFRMWARSRSSMAPTCGRLCCYSLAVATFELDTRQSQRFLGQPS